MLRRAQMAERRCMLAILDEVGQVGVCGRMAAAIERVWRRNAGELLSGWRYSDEIQIIKRPRPAAAKRRTRRTEVDDECC